MRDCRIDGGWSKAPSPPKKQRPSFVFGPRLLLKWLRRFSIGSREDFRPPISLISFLMGAGSVLAKKSSDGLWNQPDLGRSVQFACGILIKNVFNPGAMLPSRDRLTDQSWSSSVVKWSDSPQGIKRRLFAFFGNFLAAEMCWIESWKRSRAAASLRSVQACFDDGGCCEGFGRDADCWCPAFDCRFSVFALNRGLAPDTKLRASVGRLECLLHCLVSCPPSPPPPFFPSPPPTCPPPPSRLPSLRIISTQPCIALT